LKTQILYNISYTAPFVIILFFVYLVNIFTELHITFWLYMTLPAANQAAGNVPEFLRGNERAKRLTDLAKT
jgi:hypothetical protein